MILRQTARSLFITLFGVLLIPTYVQAWLSSYSRNDPCPVFTTESPYERPFLWNRERFIDKDDIERQRYVPQRFFISISPFGQNAGSTRNAKREIIPLGDIHGRWNMIALLYGCSPSGDCLPPVLVEAQQALYPTLRPPICDQPVDPLQNFGFFSIDLNYRKRGLRWDASLRICNNIVLNIEGGVSDICQTVSMITNLTDTSTFQDPCNPALTVANVDEFLMDKFDEICKAICLNNKNYHLTTAEDLRFNLIWRKLYPCDMIINDFADLYIMPFAMLSGSVAVGKEPCTNAAFGLSHGNNGHHSLGGSFGINFDWVETVDFGAEIGAVHFFPREFRCYRVPNDINQQGIFPFATDVRRSPGWNWHFAAKLGAYHFIGLLSCYFQYILMQHQDDNYCIKCSNGCFEPCLLKETSTFKSQVANIGFNYDVCPDISLGFLWQAPLMQFYAYRASTIMLSFNMFF
jgi:hypothetical protein